MAAGTTPIFFASIHNEAPHTDGDGGGAGALKTQNTNLDGTGTLLTLWTATGNGGGVTHVTLRAQGTNVITVARFFVYDGTNTNLIDEMTLNLTTASTTQGLPAYTWVPNGGVLRMQASHKLKMTLGTTVAAGYMATAFGGDY